MQESIQQIVCNFVDLKDLKETDLERGIQSLAQIISSLNNEEEALEGENLLEKRLGLELECEKSKKHILELQAALVNIKDGINAKDQTAKEMNDNCAVLSEVQERFVAPFLIAKTVEDKAKLLADIRDAKDERYEKVKAFRMIREKLEREEAALKEEEEEEVVEFEKKASVVKVYPERVMSALRILQETLKSDNLDSVDADVIASAAKCKSELLALELQDWSVVCCGFRMMIARRFGDEPEIPLFVALHHNTLLFLADLCKEKELFAEMTLCSLEGARVLYRFLEKVKEDLRLQLQLEERSFKKEKDLAEYRSSELVKACKRCFFEIQGVKKAWTKVLSPDILKWAVGELVSDVLEEAIVRFTLSNLCKDGVSVQESEIYGEKFKSCLDLSLPCLELEVNASELEKRKHVPNYPRARKIQELMKCSLADVERNISKLKSCFSKQELTTLITAMYNETKRREQLLVNL